MVERAARSARLHGLWLAIACVPIVYALWVAFCLSTALEERAAIQHEAERAARAAAQSIDRALTAGRSLLFVLSAAKSVGDADLAEFRRDAISVPRPSLSAILLYDPEGRLLFSTADPQDGVLDADAAAMLRATAVAAIRGPHASQSALTQTQSGIELAVAVPVIWRDGAHYGLVLALPAGGYPEPFRRVPTDQGWLTTFIDRSGTAAAPPGWADAAGLSREMEGAGRDGAVLARLPRGRTMLIAFSRSEESAWTAIVAVPGAIIAAPGRRAAIAIAGGSVVAFVLAMGLALLARSRMARPYLDRITAGEERFRAMADTVPAILFTATAEGRLDYVNRRFYDFTKLADGAALGFGWAGALHPKDRERILRGLAERAAEDEIVLSELRLRDGAGDYRWFLGHLRPIRDHDAQRVTWFGSATDIDHVKRSEAALQAANTRLAAVLAGIDEYYYTLDHDHRITSINDKAAAWFGREPGQLIGRKLLEVAPRLAGAEWDALQKAVDGRVPFHIEQRSVGKPGRWLEIHGYPWADGHSIFFRDITRRKATEVLLRRAQTLLQGTMDALSAHIVVLDEQGAIIAANEAWRRLGADDDRCRMGAPYLTACQATAMAADVAAIAKGLRAVIDGKAREFHTHYVGRRRGGTGWFQLRATRFDAEGRYVVVAHEDVTEIARAKMKLEELAGQLLRVQDEERRRIARDLHDSTTQNLVAALMCLDSHCQDAGDRAQAMEGSLEDARVLIERSVQELRTLSYLLHPPHLDEQGLASALKWFIRGFERRSGVKIAFDVEEHAPRPASEVENALFRVMQEALTNVHRHSGSATAQVRLRQSAHETVLEISDQGNGMGIREAEDAADGGSLGVGISGMRARLHQLGGTLKIRSTAYGTTLVARVPADAERQRPSPRQGERETLDLRHRA